MRLVLEVTLRIVEEVGGELLDGVAELDVERVVGVGGEEGLNRVEDGVLVAGVLASLGVPEALALVEELTSTAVAGVLENVSGLLEDVAEVAVELLEPVAVRRGRGLASAKATKCINGD